MQLSEYVEFIKQATHPEVHPDDLALYYELGWQGEIGEIRQLLSKALQVVRSDQPLPDEFWQKLVDELGDVLFYQIGWELANKNYVADWSRLEAGAIYIYRGDSVASVDIKLKDLKLDDSPFFAPNDHSLADLAAANYNKLVKRKDESGSYAKRL